MFKRREYHRASVPLTPATGRGVVRAVDGEVRAVPKEEPLRSESYRRYVALQECFACGVTGYSQAAHANNGKGLSIKSDDRTCFPLCSPRPFSMGCHTMHDLSIEMTRDERRAIEVVYVERMQARAKRDGRPEFAEAA